MQSAHTVFIARRTRGFTITELMVVLAVLAVLVALAAPGMRDLIVRQANTAGTQSFYEALNTARLTSMQRDVPVSVCRSTTTLDATPTCAGGEAQWHDGWLVFIDRGTIGTLEASDQIVLVHEGLRAVTTTEMPARAERITFFPTGAVQGVAGVHEVRFESSTSAGQLRRGVCVTWIGRVQAVREGEACA